MFPLINKTTHITNHSATLIEEKNSIVFGISHNSAFLVNDISDHLLIFSLGEENLVVVRDVPKVSYYSNN